MFSYFQGNIEYINKFPVKFTPKLMKEGKKRWKNFCLIQIEKEATEYPEVKDYFKKVYEPSYSTEYRTNRKPIYNFCFDEFEFCDYEGKATTILFKVNRGLNEIIVEDISLLTQITSVSKLIECMWVGLNPLLSANSGTLYHDRYTSCRLHNPKFELFFIASERSKQHSFFIEHTKHYWYESNVVKEKVDGLKRLFKDNIFVFKSNTQATLLKDLLKNWKTLKGRDLSFLKTFILISTHYNEIFYRTTKKQLG